MSIEYLPISKLFSFEKGQLQSTKCTPGKYDFITAAKEWKTHNEYDHECEALVFAAAASGSLGRTHYVNGKFISSDLCFILTPKDEKKYPINISFYHFVFNSLRSTLVAATKSGTSKESINQKNFKKYELPYFDIEQQDEWIERLINTQAKKELLSSELRHQADLLKKLRQRILQEAIEGKLTADWRAANSNVEPASELLNRIHTEKAQMVTEGKLKKQKTLPPINADEIPFDLPQGWEWARLGDITSIIGDGIHGTPVFSETGEYFFVNGNNLSDGIIEMKQDTKQTTCDEFKKYKKELNSQTVLVSINGTLGNVAFYNDEKIILGKSACYLNLLSDVHKHYIKHFINSSFFLDYAIFVASETTIKNVSLKAMRLMVIPFPPLAEQKAIVAKVETLLHLCDQLETETNNNQKNAASLLQAVLREAFSQNQNGLL